MKKSLFIFALTAFAFHTSAQSTTLGIQSNVFSSKLSFDGEVMNGFGYGGGISANFSIGKNLSLRTELNVQKRNISMNSESKEESTYYAYESNQTYKMEFAYIDFPILLDIKTASGLGIYFGPQYGTNISASYREEFSYSETDLETGETYSGSGSDQEDLNELNLGEVSFAVGTNYMLKNGLGFDLRLQHSLAVIDDGEWDSELAWTQVQFGVRYNLSLSN
jgi:hypothetical protein